MELDENQNIEEEVDFCERRLLSDDPEQVSAAAVDLRRLTRRYDIELPVQLMIDRGLVKVLIRNAGTVNRTLSGKYQTLHYREP